MSLKKKIYLKKTKIILKELILSTSQTLYFSSEIFLFQKLFPPKNIEFFNFVIFIISDQVSVLVPSNLQIYEIVTS